MKLNELSDFLEVDYDLLGEIHREFSHKESVFLSRGENEYVFQDSQLLNKYDIEESHFLKADFDSKVQENFIKICPECNRKYPEEDNFCFDCLTPLKYIKKDLNIKDIDIKADFHYDGENNYNEFIKILTDENIKKIDEFDFTIDDYEEIIYNIKLTALEQIDSIIKEYDIEMDKLSLEDKILLFAKTFVSVKFKSYGEELGHFEADTITVDERQTSSLMITTLIHELAHFLIKEILSEIISLLLDCFKNNLIEDIVTYILSCSGFTQLVDEYSAHSTEGRFTVFGFQDYSSFISIIKNLDGEMTKDEIEITKSIGNTFAYSIKDILESYIDDDMRKEIKDQFLTDRVDSPNYQMLKLENCKNLTDEGFLKAIWLILSDGFQNARINIDTFL